MALRNAFCPNCGQPTQINDEKEFSFCLLCGNKIIIPKKEQPVMQVQDVETGQESKQSSHNGIEGSNAKSDIVSVKMDAPEDKMKEAEFYYKLSIDKEEFNDIDGNPTYYLKGQDILVDLSQQYPSDYRVWWELCKPMDFSVVIEGKKTTNPATINSAYFEKALDLAPLDLKMELIKQFDTYTEAKKTVLEEIHAEQERRDAEERVRIEEEQRLQKEAAEERERLEEIQRKEAETRATEYAQAQRDRIFNFWQSLKYKNYNEIDDTFFQFISPEGIQIIATFKIVANVLYLSAFHMDPKKVNVVYLDQSVAIRFGDNGIVIKFDNKPVIVRGWDPSSNMIQVTTNMQGGYQVNNLQLIKNPAYVASVSRMAKKPLMSFKKVFI